MLKTYKSIYPQPTFGAFPKIKFEKHFYKTDIKEEQDFLEIINHIVLIEVEGEKEVEKKPKRNKRG